MSCSLLLVFLLFLPISASANHHHHHHHLRTLGEHCDAVTILCEPGLQCTQLAGKWTCRAPRPASTTVDDRCLHAKCPVVFPDCPHDTVPILIQPTDDQQTDQCCPSMVRCQCDPQKCLIPQCPDGTERVMINAGTDQPGECCDRFECRQSELRCEHIRCPDSGDTLDLYSPDGQSCPSDSFRPDPYVPSGSCCPITPQCTCRLGICEPARCAAGELLVLRRRGRGEPGRCCDEFECQREQKTGAGECRHGGRTFAEGQRWHSAPCQECQCNSGVALCRRMECPKLAHSCAWVGLMPGECCPVCMGCRDEQGLTYEPGQHWSRDDCTNCTCVDFHWQCQKFICKTDCENPIRVPGECCPVCNEPTVMKPPSSAGCPSLQHCPLRCEFGLVQNRQTGCFECKCANGTKMRVIADGEGVSSSDDEAEANVQQKCEPLTELNCARLCAHGYLRDQNGCALCRCAHCPPMDERCGKSCVHGFETNSVGCPICKCRNGGIPEGDTVPTGTSSSVPYPASSTVSSSSSLSSTTMDPSLRCVSSSSSAERDIGEWWTDSECWQCFCQQGKEFCSLISCPDRPDECSEEEWTRSSENQCCLSCLSSQNRSASLSPYLPPQQHFSQVCHSPVTGQLFVDGETWRLDGCVACTCRMGHVLCIWNDGKQCPPAPCEQPVLDRAEDQCCPRCPTASVHSTTDNTTELEPPHRGSDSDDGSSTDIVNCVDSRNGQSHAPFTEWRLDLCHSCRCSVNGHTQCFRERCPRWRDECPSGRMLSLKSRCCPICSDALRIEPNLAVCAFDGTIYARGEQFKDGPCRNCTCLSGGLIRCMEIHCPACSHGNDDANSEEDQSTAPNGTQCCPLCKADNPAVVLYSSFERGAEDQILFVGDNNPSGDSNFPLAAWAQRYQWLLVAVPALALAALFALCAAFVLAGGGGKCGMLRGAARKVKLGSGNGTRDGSWMLGMPIVAEQQRSCARREAPEGGVATSLLVPMPKERLAEEA